ncbi:LysR family transcriptional regulator [Microbacteriaceae bacterium 4G12]
MDLKWLETFISAAQNENFRKTSHELYISQPTVTVHIKSLETYLGFPLFERTGRKVKLTEEGKRFLPHAQNVLRTHEEGIQDLQRFRQGYTKQLSLAVSPLIASSTMPFLLSKYVAQFPEVEVEVQVVESKEIAAAVLEERVNIGLSRMHANHADLSCTVLAEDDVILVAPHDGSDSEFALPLEPEDLFQEHIILTHNHPEYWDDLLRQIKMHYNHIRTMTVSQVHITKRFIEEGFGVSFLPKITVRRELMEGRLLEVYCKDLILPKTKTYAVTKGEHTQGKHFLEFISQFRLS